MNKELKIKQNINIKIEGIWIGYIIGIIITSLFYLMINIIK